MHLLSNRNVYGKIIFENKSTGVAKYVKLDSAINLLLLYEEDTTKGVGWGIVGGSEREGGGIFSKWRPYC